MKIMFITSRPLEINTSSSIRNRATIKGFLALGHHVHVVTTSLNKKHYNYERDLFIEEDISKKFKITYLSDHNENKSYTLLNIINKIPYLKTIIYNMIQKLSIYDNQKSWIKFINDPIFLNMEGKYDLVISSSDPKSSHLLMLELLKHKKNNKIPWLQIWGDPFLIDITNRSLKSKTKIKNAEIELLKKADKVIYVSQPTLDKQKNLYPEFSHKMNHVAIPYLNRINYPSSDDFKGSFTFLYSGDYSSKVRDILPLYKAVKNSRHKLIICGLGDIKLQQTDRIKIYSRLSYTQVKDLEKEADILVHLSNKAGTQIPGKIYQQSGTNKWILFILDGNKENIVDNFEKYNRYIFTNNSESGILKSIYEIEQGYHNDKRFIVPDFSPTAIAERILTD